MKHFECEVKREVWSAAISVTFAEVFDTAPALPRPLKSKYDFEFITAKGLMREAHLIAPLEVDAEGEGESLVADTDTRHARQLATNTIYMTKAKEYALVHEELADWYDSILSKIRLLQMVVSGIISVVLALKVPNADNPVAIATVFLGIAKAWVDIAEYDTLCANHRTAASGFESIHEDTKAFIANLEQNKDDIAQPPASAAALPEQPKHGSTGDVEVGVCSAEHFMRTLLHEATHGAQLTLAMRSPPEDDFDPQQPMPTLRRLRRLYRETVEYRVVHALLESKFLRMNHALSFGNVVLSSSLSGVLFLSHLIPHVDRISTGMSFALTSLNTAILKLNAATRASEHGQARLAYACLQRQLATALILEPPEELYECMIEYATKFKELKCRPPKVKPVFLHGLRNKDGLMFPLITPPLASPRSYFPFTKKIQPDKE